MPISNYIVIFKIYNNVWTVTIIYGICVYCKGVVLMSILEALWYGNINPIEDRDISDEEKKLVELMARHQEYLISILKDKELDVSKNMSNVLMNTLP